MTRIKDVWSAVKTESFVLSFRNTQSIKVYRSMNKIYQEKADKLRLFISSRISEVTKNLKENCTISDKDSARILLNNCLNGVKIEILQTKSTLENEFKEEVSKLDNADAASDHIHGFLIDLHTRKEDWYTVDFNKVLNILTRNIEKRKKETHLRDFRRKIQEEAQKIVREVQNELIT